MLVMTSVEITLGSYSVLKVDGQNVIQVHGLIQQVVPLVKPEGKFPPYNPDQRYLSLLGCGTELILKQGSYDMDTLQQVLTIRDHIKVSDYLRFQFKSLPDLLVSHKFVESE